MAAVLGESLMALTRVIEIDRNTLRELFRHLQAWRALFESDGVDTVTAPDGRTFSLWDIEYLYSQVSRLPTRQRQAIQLCLIENIKEVEAAKVMGVSPTNPVASYATSGIERLIQWIEEGDLPRFRPA